MHKLKFNIKKITKLKTKNNSLTVNTFFNLQNHPTFHSEERLVNLERGRECCVGLSILLVYACRYLDSIQSKVTDEISCEKQCSFNEDFVCRSFAFYTSGWYCIIGVGVLRSSETESYLKLKTWSSI